MPDYDLFRPHADDLEHAVSKRLRLRDGVNFTIGTTQVHIGQEDLETLQRTLQQLPHKKRFEVLEAFSNLLENMTLRESK